MDISKTVRLADDQLDFVISCLNSCVAHAEPYCIQYVLPVTLELEVLFLESINPTVACPLELSFEGIPCFVRILDFQEKAKHFLHPVSSVQAVIVFSDHGYPVLLVLR